ncbi:MAG: hypothetical protein E6Q97_37060 [Desulfurellales bacterium]|nr:MAG: hypothetical protein E6Q97_37060 [Desulfurellales bacterium]
MSSVKKVAKVKTVPYYSVSGAAELCGCREGTIRAAMKTGNLRAVRTIDGRAPLVGAKDLDRWKTAREGRRHDS